MLGLFELLVSVRVCILVALLTNQAPTNKTKKHTQVVGYPHSQAAQTMLQL